MAGVVIVPEKTLKKLNSYILPQWKVCFIVALTVGLLAHLYKITSWLPNWDSLVFRYDSQNMLGLGRWFLPVVCSLSSFYDLPLLNGIISIVFHALGAVCICKVFNVQGKITAGLIGAIIVSFPTVTSVMMYNYVADGYAIAFFLSVLATLYMTKEKPNFILATLLVALSAGIYQAYITVTVMLILLHLTDELVFKGASFKALLKKAVFMLLSGALGVVLYGIILKILLALFSVSLLDYQGIGDTSALSGINLPASLYVIKETFINCFFDLSEGVNVYVLLNAFVLVFTLSFYIKNIIEKRLYKEPLKLLMLVLLGVGLIVGAGALALINPAVDYHSLMIMGYAVFYLFFLLIYERGKVSAIKCWTVFTVACIMVANQVVIANVSYHKAQIAYEKSYGVLIRIADRIEETEGSEECDKILVIGALDGSEAYSVNLTPNVTGITDGYIIRADDEVVAQSVLSSALNDYCSKNYVFLKGDEKKAFLQKDVVKAMGEWPAKDSVAIVDDTVVIKLSTEGERS